MKYILIALIILYPTISDSKNYKWSGKGKLYDQRNQYTVTCRLVKKKELNHFW